MIELLTVLAIVAVLATLLLSAISSSKRKARQVSSISNLRQISLAANLFRDDEERPPTGFAELVKARYLAGTNVLNCPEDRLGDWGGRIQSGPVAFPAAAAVFSPVAASYLHSFSGDPRAWESLAQRSPSLGMAVCQLHGIGAQNRENPAVSNFEGLIWRAQVDGAVVRRQIFWNQFDAMAMPLDAALLSFDAAGSRVELLGPAAYMHLFFDHP